MYNISNKKVNIMNNFEALKNNIIPSDVLVKLLDTYKMIGSNELISQTIDEEEAFLVEKNIENITYTLSRRLKLKVNENRLRLIIIKNSSPLNLEEKKVKGIKEVIANIIKDAENNTFNGSDILQYLNHIFGKNSHKFTNRIYNELLAHDYDLKKTSIRLILENMIDEYHVHITKKDYEAIYLSLIVYLFMDLMRPYTDHNELAGELALYYMLIRIGIKPLKYVDFFAYIDEVRPKWEQEMQLCYINFPKSPLQLNNFIPILLSIINKAYNEITIKIKDKNQEKRMFKRDGIEQTIYMLPNTFTKEDIRKYHPMVSESTLNRTLFALRDKGIIMPLGKGRSARWIKLLDENDPRNIFGGNYESNDQE